MKFNYTKISDKHKPKKVLNYSKIAGKPCKDIDLKSKTLYKDMEKLGWEMVQTCLKEDGIGLAAPQIGVFKNVFISVGFQKPDTWSFDGHFHMYINPIIKQIKNPIMTSFPEGCLSVPGETYDIKRPMNIIMEYWYFDDKKHLKKSPNEPFVGFPARLVQHEYDHLAGTNIVELHKKQNNKLKRGKPSKKNAV